MKKFLDKLEKDLSVKNWFPDYNFNKWVFRSAIILIVVLFFCIWVSSGFVALNKNYVYFECGSASFGACENPFYDLCNSKGELFYQDSNICDDLDSSMYEEQFVLVGYSVGEKPSWLLSNSLTFAYLIILLAFIFNHLVFNKNYKFRGIK